MATSSQLSACADQREMHKTSANGTNIRTQHTQSTIGAHISSTVNMLKTLLFVFSCLAILQLLPAQDVVEDLDFVFPNLEDVPLDAPTSRQISPLSRDKMYVVSAFTKVNWYTAQQICGFRGLSLASINSQLENDKLIKYLQDNGLTSNGEVYWLSGTSLAQENKWIWLNTGRPLVYRNWAMGEPNNFSSNERCMSISADGRWKGLNCYSKAYFVCETHCPLSSYDVPIEKKK